MKRIKDAIEPYIWDRFKLPISYKVRDAILLALYENDVSINRKPNPMGAKAIAKASGYDIEYIHYYYLLLKEEKEINVVEVLDDHDHEHVFKLTSLGAVAVVNCKYLKEGRTAMWGYFELPFKTILPMISLLISLAAFYISYTTHKENLQERKLRMEQLIKKSDINENR